MKQKKYEDLHKRHFKLRTKVRHSKISLYKKYFFSFIFILIISITFYLSYDLFSSGLFNITEINVLGLSTVDKGDFLKNFPVKLNQNIFITYFYNFSKYIKEIYPQIKSIKVKRTFPCSLNIVVYERKPIAFSKVGDKNFFIDEFGKIFFLKMTYFNLPQIVFIDNEVDYKICVEFIKCLKQTDVLLLKKIKEIKFNNNDMFINLDSSTQIIWGDFDKKNFKEKLSFFYRTLRDKKFSNFEYINLKLFSEGRVIIKPRIY